MQGKSWHCWDKHIYASFSPVLQSLPRNPCSFTTLPSFGQCAAAWLHPTHARLASQHSVCNICCFDQVTTACSKPSSAPRQCCNSRALTSRYCFCSIMAACAFVRLKKLCPIELRTLCRPTATQDYALILSLQYSSLLGSRCNISLLVQPVSCCFSVNGCKLLCSCSTLNDWMSLMGL